jgi:hypothetical protein
MEGYLLYRILVLWMKSKSNNLPEMMTMGFYTKGKIELMHASVIPSKCNGYFCDKQRIHDLDKQLGIPIY